MLGNHNFIIAIWLACLATLASSLVYSQTIWEGDDLVNSMSWHVAGNWSTGVVPDTMTNTIVGAPAPTIISSASASALTLEVESAGEIEIEGSRTLTIFGTTLTNDGKITVNSNNSTNLATLNLGNAGLTLDGSGEIVLGAIVADSRIVNGVNPTTQQADHTIRGEGDVALQLINFGTITASDANGDSSAEMLLSTGAKTNHGTIQSSPTASMRLAISLTQGNTGQLIADTSPVLLNNITIAGGTLISVSGGEFRTSGNALTFDGVQELEGQLNLVSNTGLTGNLIVRGGGFTNNGTILANLNNIGATSLQFPESGTLDGTGEIILNSPSLGSVISSGTNAIGTFGPNQTIRGVGQIQGAIINEGLIIAEPRNGGTDLLLNNLPKTNNSIIRADAGARIDVSFLAAITQDDVNGQLIANEGIIQLRGDSMIRGGRLEAIGTGKVVVAGNSRLEDLTNNAPIEIQGGALSLTLGGTSIENNNVIQIGSNLRIAGNLEISGAGEIILDSGSTANVDVVTGFTATLGSGQVLRRTPAGSALSSRVSGPGTFINNGRVEGASPAALLNFNGRVGGSGTMKHVNIRSVHAPGDPGGTAQVMLEGVYEISNFGTRLELEIGGTTPGIGYDQLFSTDPTNLISIVGGNSQLNVSFINGFFPTNGDIFTLIDTVGSISGSFTQINLPSLPSGFSWLNLSDPDTIAYQFIAPSAADFEEDGDVDGNDLTRWQANYGTGTTHMQGDADEDMDVDGRDFLIWQRQFGIGVPTLAVSQAIPEPASLSLFSAILWGFCLRPRSRRK